MGLRKKEWRVLVTFDTTTQAMAMESVCHEKKVSGRLIPVPGEVRAGCGMAWMTSMEDREQIERLLANQKMGYDEIQEIYF